MCIDKQLLICKENAHSTGQMRQNEHTKKMFTQKDKCVEQNQNDKKSIETAKNVKNSHYWIISNFLSFVNTFDIFQNQISYV